MQAQLYKTFKESTGENLCDFELDSEFLTLTLKKKAKPDLHQS